LEIENEKDPKIKRFIAEKSEIIQKLIERFNKLISNIEKDSDKQTHDYVIETVNKDGRFSLSIIILFRILAFNGLNKKKAEANIVKIRGEIKNLDNWCQALANETNYNLNIWNFDEISENFNVDNEGSDINLFHDGENSYFSLFNDENLAINEK
jgi:hypothetical protein